MRGVRQSMRHRFFVILNKTMGYMKIYNGLLGMLMLALVSCGGEKTAEKNEEEKTAFAFTPKAGEKKQMVYEFDFDLPSQKANVGFMCDIGLEVTATQNGKHEIALSYNKVCAKGNYAGIEINLCSGDTVPNELMRVVTPVFSYLNSVYQLQFDDRMRKTGEALVSSDSTKGHTGLTSKMQFFTVLPDSSVSIGDTWEEDLDWSAANQKKARITYTYKSKKGSNAVFSFKGELKTTGEGFGEEYTMHAILTGEVEVDVTTGWTVDAEMKQDVTMKVGEKPAETATYTYRMRMK